MAAYYNEHDPFAAQWLRNLIAAGHIAPGDVDERSIEDVFPSDLAGYSQCHFFSGIGGWSYALRLAGWPDDRPVWTGSCPCQPFSTAGKKAAFADERHLWPAWHNLIAQCKPAIVFGEQVASPAGYAWLDLVQTDLEGTGYAFGPVVLPSAGVGAPHIRSRVWFAANKLGISDSPGWKTRIVAAEAARYWCASESAGCGGDGHTSQTNGFWNYADWIRCRDGKWRPVEPGTFPLAHGVSCRVDKLRAYGNAIVPQVAESFIRAYLESGGAENRLKCTA